MSYKTATPYWDTDVLVRSLKCAGWGVLATRDMQGVRNTLVALSDIVSAKSGMGKSTAFQLSIHTGLSERWVRRCLHVLEEMGIITWSRGDVMDNKTRPSRFKINKKILVELINNARKSLHNLKRGHRAKTIRRIEKIKLKWCKSKRSPKIDLTGLNSFFQQELSNSHSLINKSTTCSPSVVVPLKESYSPAKQGRKKVKGAVMRISEYRRYDIQASLEALEQAQEKEHIKAYNWVEDQVISDEELFAFGGNKGKAIVFRNFHSKHKGNCDCCYVR